MQVAFPLQLDVFEFCTEEVKAELKAPRAAMQAHEDAKAGLGKSKSADPEIGGGEAGKAEAKDVDGDSAMAGPEQGADDEASGQVGKLTGRYDLIAVLTHCGRSLDSGHYIGWVKQADKSWIQFDDDKMISRKDEDILALCGGSDSHAAYMMLFKPQRVPADINSASSPPS
jgi:ubiquitin carboxyl-terminal hydrolase 14